MDTSALRVDSPSRRTTYRRPFLLAVLAAIVFTGFVISRSQADGRLAHEPLFDDVIYMVDGAQRLQVLQEKGCLAAASDLLKRPPHSLLSTAQAMLSFGLLGLKESSPYVFNGFILLAFLWASLWAARATRLRDAAAVLAMGLCLPLSFWSVHEFRPDFACALITSLSMVFLARLLFDRKDAAWRHYAACGGFLALALYAKPHFFAHTLAFAVGGSVAVALLGARLRRAPGPYARFSLAFFGGFAVMAAPLFAWDGQTFITYFYTNAIGVNAFLWTIKGSFWAVVKCYVWSYGPGQMLGWFGPFLLAGALAGLGAIPRNARATPLFLLGSSVCSLAVMLIGRHDNPFFGLSYQLLLWFAFLQIFLFAQPSRFWKPLLLLLFFCAFLGNYTRPPEGEIFRRGDSRTGLHYNEDLVDAIARDGGLKDHKHPAQVFLTVTGDVNIYAMRWQLCKRRRPLCFSAMARSTDPAAFIEAFRDADYVIVPAPGARGVYAWIPAFQAQEQIRRYLRAENGFTRLGLPPRLAEYMVFRNEAKATAPR